MAVLVEVHEPLCLSKEVFQQKLSPAFNCTKMEWVAGLGLTFKCVAATTKLPSSATKRAAMYLVVGFFSMVSRVEQQLRAT